MNVIMAGKDFVYPRRAMSVCARFLADIKLESHTLSGASQMKTLFARFMKDESGATAIEYGLIAGLISVVVITAVTTVGTKISGDFSKIAANL